MARNQLHRPMSELIAISARIGIAISSGVLAPRATRSVSRSHLVIAQHK
jgi:hypothetical protein